MPVVFPKGYRNLLGTDENTEKAIRFVKSVFQENLSAQLALLRVTAPMAVASGSGINDDLNGTEHPVSFPVRGLGGRMVEIVHSLAKWKRLKLRDMSMPCGRGIYTDMNAIRPEEDLDNIHSVYVDQWDWEKVIDAEDRNLEFLRKTVRGIYESLRVTENRIYVEFPQLGLCLPDDIVFIHSEELLRMYPSMDPKDREREIVKKHGAVFLIGIGGILSDGRPHDGRAADYDDWSSINGEGSYQFPYRGLNGDILLWNPVLEDVFEISSMGIRVDSASLSRQLAERGEEWKAGMYYHRLLLSGGLPYTVGGGIGQSRLCMFLLRKAHIGEVQSSVWPDDMRRDCLEHGIRLL